MKAKSRKRLLISSVAMLLVAMLALGTATFAWFTSSTTATASGINVQTTQASELQISKTDLNWGTSVNYATTATFEPASSANGANWFTAEAGARDSYEKKNGTNFVALTAANKSGYVFEETLNVRNHGAAAVTGVTITFSIAETPATTGKNYVRVALVPVTVSGTVNTTTLAAATPAASDFQAGVFDVDGVAYNAVSAVDAAATEITPKTTYSVNVGDLAGGSDAAKYYKLYVWFEGQDQDCADVNAGNAMPSIQFSVTGTTSNS